MAQYQRRHIALLLRSALPAPVANSQFDLGNMLYCVHGRNQITQGQKHVAHVLRQHRAALHIRNEMAFTFVKTNQHCAFFTHKAHRQTGAVAVGPGRAFNCAQDAIRAQFADVAELVFQGPLLDGHLRRRMQMLHLAAAAGAFMQAEMRAVRYHPLRGFAVHLGERALVKTRLAAVDAGAHHLIGQSAVNKHHLAIGTVRHALAF